MSGILLGLAALFSLVVLAIGIRFPARVRQITGVSWVLLAGIGVAVHFLGVNGYSLAACAGMMALTAGLTVRPDETGALRSGGLTLALMIPLGLWADVAWVHDYHAILSVGVAGAIAASVVGWASVLPSRALSLAGVGAAGGAMIIGYARGAQIGTGYHLPLSDGKAPIHWELAPMERLPEGLRILATGPIPDWMFGSILGLLLAGVIVAALWSKSRIRQILAAVGALLGASVIYGLSAIRAGGLPPTDSYMEVTRQLLMSRGLGESALAQVQFRSSATVVVDVQAMVPEFILWFMAVAFFLLTFKPSDSKVDVGSFERAAAIGWVSWFLALIFQINLFGVPGIHSASEWVLLGCVLIGTCAAMAAPYQGNVGQKLREFAPLMVVLVWLLSLSVSWVFRAPLGLSLSL